jgi:hypothetical protein
MKLTKKIDFGEYLIVANYDSVRGSLEVTILDELDEIIETINVMDDSEDDDYDDSLTNPSLN